jgi:hypothetical protein
VEGVVWVDGAGDGAELGGFNPSVLAAIAGTCCGPGTTTRRTWRRAFFTEWCEALLALAVPCEFPLKAFAATADSAAARPAVAAPTPQLARRTRRSARSRRDGLNLPALSAIVEPILETRGSREGKEARVSR